MANVRVAAVTTIGQKHINRGVPCEDSSIAVSKNGVSVVVVADGAGSKQYTHARFGSAGACEVISDLFINHFDAIYNENREAAISSLVIAAIQIKFADLMVEHDLDSIERLSCTLLFTAVKDRRMIVGHIGDGLTVRVSPSGISPLTMPQNGTNASSTYFVTAPHAADYLRLIKTTTDDIHAVALMTDGVQDSVYDENSGCVKPVVSKMTETLAGGREKSEDEIKQILEKHIVGASNNSDDASFGILYFEDTSAPNTGDIPTSQQAFPRVEETFKDIQTSMIEDVKRARKIMSEKMASKPVGNAPETEAEKTKKGETETAAADTVDKIEPPLAGAKKTNLMLLIAAIVELIAIVVLIVILYSK